LLLLCAGATLRAERARASALSDERNRLETALQAAADQAASAEAQAAAARAEAEMSAQLAARAEQDALQAQQRLQEAEQEKQAVQAQLETVSEVVEQQQEELKVKEVQVGQLQQVVVDTRELSAVYVSRLGSTGPQLCVHAVCL
jgi:chromosome segregation ATPase